MTWSYDSALTLSKDQVRFLIGDTTQSDPLVQDEEINWALSVEGNVFSAAALVATTLASTFAGKVEKAVGDLKIRYGDQYNNYLVLAKQLRARVTLDARAMSAGAESVSDKEVDELNTGLVQPFFRRETHDSTAQTIDPNSRWLS
jgi:hypothetical protein